MQINFDTAINSAEGLVGGLYDTSLNQIDSFVAGEDIPFGCPVEYDFTNNVIKKLTSAQTAFLGVAMRTNYAVPGSVLAATAAVTASDQVTTITSGISSFPAGSQVSVMKMGRIFVKVTTATTKTIGAKITFNKTSFFYLSDEANSSGNLVIGRAVRVPSKDGIIVPIQVLGVTQFPLI